ncbi:uncharacterized protein [Nicotiana sylvestris]|uniref:uncharacterized protein n=1 Tax=Nicotiana sylvestris TaxID=4096 RepID=UPI00388C972C
MDASMLFNHGSTYSYVSSYVAHYLDMPRDSLVMLVHVSATVGDSIMVDCVYRSCVVKIGGYKTRVDILFLSMVDFHVILGMDWLSPYHTILVYHAKTVKLAMLGLPRLEWRGSLDHVPSRVISYLKSQQIAEKGCLALMRDVSVDIPTIDLVLGTQPISILPYDMAPIELKDLKEQLQELFDKGFIGLNVSS